VRPLSVYVETSVFGFLLDETELNRTKREATERMFEQIRDGRLVAYASELVMAELAETPDSISRRVLMELARELRFLSEPAPEEIDFLVERYMTQRAFPEDKRDDAAHVAIVVLSPAIEAMVSWNCRHLANEYNRRRLKALTLAEGYSFHFEIITPEEVLSYE
jgi:hypothetical protein